MRAGGYLNFFKYDFGYEWPWTYGHLIPVFVFGLLVLLARRRNWPAWSVALLLIPPLWGVTGFWIVHAALRFNQPLELPTEQFFRNGAGRVLDAGAGSGRSTLMVLLSRPHSNVVALDLFNAGYGIGDNTPERLLRNAARAGVADRIQVQQGDMREMPFKSNTFDAAVSAFAIDHLPQDGVMRALSEVRRILKPGGEFLLLVVNPDVYIRVAWPLVAEHGYLGPQDAKARWSDALRNADFELIEAGASPGALYLLARSKNQRLPPPPAGSAQQQLPRVERR